ncbi:MAG: DoxX family protein [Cytophagales bacterium]|nr:DoxX family protein [Cytophagales bacterium]
MSWHLRWDERGVIWELFRILLGGVFIFSACVKLNDPRGLEIKLEEYFQVFGGLFVGLTHVALFLALFLILLELLLGLCLWLSYRLRITVWSILGLLIFFTFLTFYSAYYDKVRDCGCFGDAIPLSPWQSFSKDLVLLGLTGYLLIFPAAQHSVLRFRSLGDKLCLGILSFFTVLTLFLGGYVSQHIPWIDFRPYKIGTDIGLLRKPSGKPVYAYVMERDGKEYRFDSYPTEGGYNFKEMVLQNPEVLPKLQDYRFWGTEDMTEKSLIGKKLLIIIHRFSEASESDLGDLDKIIKRVPSDWDIWLLSSSTRSEYELLDHNYAWMNLPLYFADETLLKTMLRANPGLFLLNEGRVVGKTSVWGISSAWMDRVFE